MVHLLGVMMKKHHRLNIVLAVGFFLVMVIVRIWQ